MLHRALSAPRTEVVPAVGNQGPGGWGRRSLEVTAVAAGLGVLLVADGSGTPGGTSRIIMASADLTLPPLSTATGQHLTHASFRETVSELETQIPGGPLPCLPPYYAPCPCSLSLPLSCWGLPGISRGLPGIRGCIPGIRGCPSGIRRCLLGIMRSLPRFRRGLLGIRRSPPGDHALHPGTRRGLSGTRGCTTGI